VLLAVDIGNTNIGFALFKRGRIIRRFEIPRKGYSKTRLFGKLKNLSGFDAIICSVVPQQTRTLCRDLKKIAKKTYIIGKDIEVPIKNLYHKPKQLGQDRMVNAYAARELYGKPLVVIDLGTAITIDCVNKEGAYLGGMILPGLNLSLSALSEKTALLPKISLRRPKGLIGKDTESSIINGVVLGFAVTANSLSKRISGKIGKNVKIILTGGDACFIREYFRKNTRMDMDLTSKGLYLVYRNTL